MAAVAQIYIHTDKTVKQETKWIPNKKHRLLSGAQPNCNICCCLVSIETFVPLVNGKEHRKILQVTQSLDRASKTATLWAYSSCIICVNFETISVMGCLWYFICCIYLYVCCCVMLCCAVLCDIRRVHLFVLLFPFHGWCFPSGLSPSIRTAQVDQFHIKHRLLANVLVNNLSKMESLFTCCRFLCVSQTVFSFDFFPNIPFVAVVPISLVWTAFQIKLINAKKNWSAYKLN